MAERVPGGFAGVYPVLKAIEEAGRCRRGYFVEGLGGAQFAQPGAVDRLRAVSASRSAARRCSPPPIPPIRTARRCRGPSAAAIDAGHRPGRKAGAAVVLVDGALVLYVERGGRTLLSYGDDAAVMQRGGRGARRRRRARARSADSRCSAPTARRCSTRRSRAALAQAGFHPTPWGMRVRA